MKDPWVVLHHKEHDVERVRREIEALVAVIPLLADDQTSSDELRQLIHSASARFRAQLPDNDMADLETYYPFVRGMRESERR